MLVSRTRDSQLAQSATGIAAKSATFKNVCKRWHRTRRAKDSRIDTVFFAVDVEVYRLVFDNRKGLHMAGDESFPFLTWPSGTSTERPFPEL